MGEKRIKWSEMQLIILYNEVDGLCPMCQKPLWYTKGDKEIKLFEVAHIYPLNPTTEEKEILKDEPLLFSKDKNDLNNVIALCPNCHTFVDKPTSVETYRKLYNLKKRFLNKDKIRSLYSSYAIEEDIIKIVDLMSNCSSDDIQKINYELISVDNKINSNKTILKNKVKSDVTQYYLFIRRLFYDLDKNNPGIFDLIAGQIKSFYLKVKSISSDQDDIYEYIASWLQSKYKIGSIEAYKIIVSFFIQNCEVFSDVTK